MKTYQDLIDVGKREKDRIQFILDAINEHKHSEAYLIAFDAMEYARKNNVTIKKFEKIIYTLKGEAIPDRYSPNHKIPSNFFGRFVNQQNQYLLGNGVQLETNEKEKLGKKFDQKLQRLGYFALVQGVSFGFWNLDHVEIFKLTEFVPLYDEETGALCAGIRFFQLANDKPLRATLYELDGYTDYIKKSDKEMTVLNEKRTYTQIVLKSDIDGEEVKAGENYESFPIVPLWANENHQSEIEGIRESIDAYDLIKSGFGNDMDGAQMYWLFKNAGGMDDIDIAKAIERINVLHAAIAEDDNEIAPHEISIPYEARVEYLDRLEQDMYNDYQALRISEISAGNKTATEIDAAYQPLDEKADHYEYCVLDFLEGLFALAGVTGDPSFVRNKVATRSDDMQLLLMAANYLDDAYITRKACAILGDPDGAEDILKRKGNTDISRLRGSVNNG